MEKHVQEILRYLSDPHRPEKERVRRLRTMRDKNRQDYDSKLLRLVSSEILKTSRSFPYKIVCIAEDIQKQL